ncbi:MAG: hypothetical protein AAEJ57_02185 [Opitutales bacterium]
METKSGLQSSDLEVGIARFNNLPGKKNLSLEEAHDESKVSPVFTADDKSSVRAWTGRIATNEWDHVREASLIALGEPYLTFFGCLPR